MKHWGDGGTKHRIAGWMLKCKSNPSQEDSFSQGSTHFCPVFGLGTHPHAKTSNAQWWKQHQSLSASSPLSTPKILIKVLLALLIGTSFPSLAFTPHATYLSLFKGRMRNYPNNNGKCLWSWGLGEDTCQTLPVGRVLAHSCQHQSGTSVFSQTLDPLCRPSKLWVFNSMTKTSISS